eukprot:3369820-Pyramimonas_sp.AAC.1
MQVFRAPQTESAQWCRIQGLRGKARGGQGGCREGPRARGQRRPRLLSDDRAPSRVRPNRGPDPPEADEWRKSADALPLRASPLALPRAQTS